MKDIVITSARLIKELFIFATTFIIAFFVNVIAVFLFDTPWYEIFTQIGYVIALTLLLYLVVIIFRLIFLAGKYIVKIIKHGLL